MRQVQPKDDSLHANAGTFRERNLFFVFLRKASGYILLQNPGGLWSCGICFLTLTSKNSCTKSNQEFQAVYPVSSTSDKRPLGVCYGCKFCLLLHQIKRFNWHFGAIWKCWVLSLAPFFFAFQFLVSWFLTIWPLHSLPLMFFVCFFLPHSPLISSWFILAASFQGRFESFFGLGY